MARTSELENLTDDKARHVTALNPPEGVTSDQMVKLGKMMFIFNGWQGGAISGMYVVIQDGSEFVIGQMHANLGEPLQILDGHRYSSAEEASNVAECLQEADRRASVEK